MHGDINWLSQGQNFLETIFNHVRAYYVKLMSEWQINIRWWHLEVGKREWLHCWSKLWREKRNLISVQKRTLLLGARCFKFFAAPTWNYSRHPLITHFKSSYAPSWLMKHNFAIFTKFNSSYTLFCRKRSIFI